MRKEHDGKGREYVTPRTLMSVLRMSQALARIRMSGDGRSTLSISLRVPAMSNGSYTCHHQHSGGLLPPTCGARM